MRVADTVAALCVALLGITTIALARQLPYEAEYGPGPGYLPFWLGVLLVVLSVFLLRGALRKGTTIGPEDDGGDNPARFWQFAPGAFLPWLIFFVTSIAVSLTFERLGFGLGIGLYMLVTMRWVARRSWPATIILAVATPIVLYIAFARLLKVPLPLTPLGF